MFLLFLFGTRALCEFHSCFLWLESPWSANEGGWPGPTLLACGVYQRPACPGPADLGEGPRARTPGRVDLTTLLQLGNGGRGVGLRYSWGISLHFCLSWN